MIDFNDMTVTIGRKKGIITNFEVWWMTPIGLAETLQDAKDKLTELNIPFDVLKPLVVAVSENGLYEPLG